MTKREPLTFENYDLLDLKKFSERLENFIVVEQDFVEGSLVVALTGGFGAGKSTLIEMWAESLKARRQNGEFLPMPVLLNAWESDHCGDPLLAILAGLIEVIDNWNGSDAPLAKTPLKESAKEAAWFLAGVGNGMIAKASGIDVVKAKEAASKKVAKEKQPIPDIIELFSKRKKALKDLKEKLSDSLGGNQTKVIFFVDELDRCRPDYAVAYLEVIKHVFDVSGLAFILAVDYPHLENSAKSLFGGDLDFNEYFRKFAHRTIALPVPSEQSQSALAKNYASKYLNLAGKRSSTLDVTDGFERRVVNLLTAFPLKPRQVQEVFRILGSILQTVDAEKIGKLKWAIGAGAMLMSYLRIADSSLFYSTWKSNEGTAELCRQLVSRLGKHEGRWWVELVLSGAWESNSDNDWTTKVLIELELIDDANSRKLDFIGGFSSGWGDYPRNWIKRLATLIESIQQI